MRLCMTCVSVSQPQEVLRLMASGQTLTAHPQVLAAGPAARMQELMQRLQALKAPAGRSRGVDGPPSGAAEEAEAHRGEDEGAASMAAVRQLLELAASI